MATPTPFNALREFVPRFTPQGFAQRTLQQIQADAAAGGRAAANYAASRLGSSAASVTEAAAPAAARMGLGGILGGVGRLLPGIGWGMTAAAIAQPAFQAVGSALRTPQGQDFKNRLYQGNIGGALQALGIGRPNVPTLQQYNPPGFNPNSQVTSADLLSSTRQVSSHFSGGGQAQGSVTPPGGAPQDRAYHEAAISAAQQAAQNPLFQKYQVADLTKQYNAATTNEEKQRIGLQIWAQTNPALARKLQSGQVGYAEAQSAPGMSNAGGNPVQHLPMLSNNFNTALASSSFINNPIDFGKFVPGAGMTSTTPQVNFDTTKSLYPPITDNTTNFINQTLNYDPAALAISESQRKTLIDYYNANLRSGLAK